MRTWPGDHVTVQEPNPFQTAVENYCGSQRVSSAARQRLLLGLWSNPAHVSLCFLLSLCQHIPQTYPCHPPENLLPLERLSVKECGQKIKSELLSGFMSVGQKFTSRQNQSALLQHPPPTHLLSPGPISLLSHLFSLEQGIFRRPLPPFDATTGKLDLGDVLRQARRLCRSCNFKLVLLQRRR